MKTFQFILTILVLASMTGASACSQFFAGQTATSEPTIPTAHSEQEWPPAGMIAFSKTKGGNGDDLYLIHTDGTGLMQLGNGPDPWNEYPSWSPDGSRIAYHAGDSKYRSDGVWTIQPTVRVKCNSCTFQKTADGRPGRLTVPRSSSPQPSPIAAHSKSRAPSRSS